MAEVKINLLSFQKDVLVEVPDGLDAAETTEAFNEASLFVRTLEANSQIRDLETGINPPRATHEIVKGKDGAYRLNRFRFM